MAAAAAALVITAGMEARAADPLPSETHKVLPLALAIEAAQGAIAQCKTQGYNVAVSIVERTGAPQLLLVENGTGVLPRQLSGRKAYTAAVRGLPTGELAKLVAQPGAFNPTLYDTEMVTAQGGLPIKVGKETIGGIGVSGAPGGDKDEACAGAGLEKIADRLN
jgi:uncharacterized protein GlcG (DUF336 family)